MNARIVTVAFTVAAGMAGPAAAQSPEVQAFVKERYAQLEEIAAKSPTFAAALDSARGHFILAPVGAPGTIAVVPERPGEDYIAVFLNYEAHVKYKVTREEWEYVLVHEIYGHLLPLLKGEVCPDPKPGQKYRSSCVGKRTAVVLRELGRMPPRHYGLFRWED